MKKLILLLVLAVCQQSFAKEIIGEPYGAEIEIYMGKKDGDENIESLYYLSTICTNSIDRNCSEIDVYLKKYSHNLKTERYHFEGRKKLAHFYLPDEGEANLEESLEAFNDLQYDFFQNSKDYQEKEEDFFQDPGLYVLGIYGTAQAAGELSYLLAEDNFFAECALYPVNIGMVAGGAIFDIAKAPFVLAFDLLRNAIQDKTYTVDWINSVIDTMTFLPFLLNKDLAGKTIIPKRDSNLHIVFRSALEEYSLFPKHFKGLGRFSKKLRFP